MAETQKPYSKDDLQRDLASKRATNENTGTPAAKEVETPPVNTTTETTTPATTPTTTSEFNGDKAPVNTDPTMPVKKNGMTSYAEKPIRTEEITVDDKKITVAIYRVYEKNGDLVEVPCEIGTGKKLEKEGQKSIATVNSEAIERSQERMATLKHNNAPRVKMMEYLQFHSRFICVVTPNNSVPELVVVTDVAKNAALDQKRLKSIIREKSTGGVKTWILLVPTRAYNYVAEGNAFDIDTVNEIISDKQPKLSITCIPKDKFPMVLMSVFGGPIKCLDETFDTNTAAYASVKEIPSINGLPAGKEVIYYNLDKKKAGLTSEQPKLNPGELQDNYNKRLKSWAEAQERGQRLKSGGMTLAERASIIKISSNARSNMVSRNNHIPFRTFNTIPVGTVLQPDRARELNEIYLRKLELPSSLTSTVENSKLIKEGDKIESSIYFPTTPAQAGKIPTTKTYFKTRDKEGKLVKSEYTPSKIILKKSVKSEKGEERFINDAVSIGEPGYSEIQYSTVKTLFLSAISKLPDEQRCAFVTEEEIVAANKNARATSSITKISGTAIDKQLLDLQVAMLSLSVDNGSTLVDINETLQNIDAIRTARSVDVPTRKRLSPELQAKLKAELQKTAKA